MTWRVSVAETDLSLFSAYVTGVPAWLDAPARSYPLLTIPGRMGGVLAADPTAEARQLRITGSIDPSTRTVAARQAAEGLLKSLLYRGLVAVTTDDDSTSPRRIDGVCTRFEITPKGHPLVATVSTFELTVLCPDPTWYDLQAQLVAFGATATPVPCGSAPAGGIIRIAAPSWSANVTNPTVTYAAASASAVYALAFTGSLTLTAGTDYLEIDIDRATVAKVSSGVRTNAINTLTSGDFFAIDPMDGDYTAASYPTLQVTATGGTPSGTYLGSRRWL